MDFLELFLAYLSVLLFPSSRRSDGAWLGWPLLRARRFRGLLFYAACWLRARGRRANGYWCLSLAYACFVCEDGQCQRQIAEVIYKPAATQTVPHPIPYITLNSPW